MRAKYRTSSRKLFHNLKNLRGTRGAVLLGEFPHPCLILAIERCLSKLSPGNMFSNGPTVTSGKASSLLVNCHITPRATNGHRPKPRAYSAVSSLSRCGNMLSCCLLSSRHAGCQRLPSHHETSPTTHYDEACEKDEISLGYTMPTSRRKENVAFRSHSHIERHPS